MLWPQLSRQLRANATVLLLGAALFWLALLALASPPRAPLLPLLLLVAALRAPALAARLLTLDGAFQAAKPPSSALLSLLLTAAHCLLDHSPPPCSLPFSYAQPAPPTRRRWRCCATCARRRTWPASRSRSRQRRQQWRCGDFCDHRNDDSLNGRLGKDHHADRRLYIQRERRHCWAAG